MKIAIHQPNFIPYYPFFQKMAAVDVFVILIECQFEKNNFQNRFFYGGWNTMAVNKGLEPIKNKKYVNHSADWEKIIKRHPKLNVFNDLISESLCKTNVGIIKRTAELLNIETPVFYDHPTPLTSTSRLVEICKQYNATEYLSGISGKKYLNLKEFEMNNIKVSFQDEKTMVRNPLIEII